jgi:hypothetical protein
MISVPRRRAIYRIPEPVSTVGTAAKSKTIDGCCRWLGVKNHHCLEYTVTKLITFQPLQATALLGLETSFLHSPPFVQPLPTARRTLSDSIESGAVWHQFIAQWPRISESEGHVQPSVLVSAACHSRCTEPLSYSRCFSVSGQEAQYRLADLPQVRVAPVERRPGGPRGLPVRQVGHALRRHTPGPPPGRAPARSRQWEPLPARAGQGPPGRVRGRRRHARHRRAQVRVRARRLSRRDRRARLEQREGRGEQRRRDRDPRSRRDRPPRLRSGRGITGQRSLLL